MTDSLIQIVCPSCSAKNRLSKARLHDKPLCGKCGKPLLSSSPVTGNDKNFSRYITDNGLPVVVDFWAPWCGPCKQFAPTFEQVAGEMSAQACFVRLDTEHNQHTAGGYNIRSIPTLVIFHHGKEIARMSGALPQPQFKQWLAQNLPAV
ncbi:thioredoxin TrxC [Desulforhopalus vacuolatus]|uniref:thioredoxin TrxC n=1 Tax=Desulforhopalus vacuolatus TaxID=40414 RepID=UPI0019668C39|nr:thioredoxin TrxC [Desulforhopalus vacuolatus]MBM9520559.1 thioredoxin TrxC [Desulforhopalus vacuolatus]